MFNPVGKNTDMRQVNQQVTPLGICQMTPTCWEKLAACLLTPAKASCTSGTKKYLPIPEAKGLFSLTLDEKITT